MLTKLQTKLIQWILEPLYRVKKHIPESVWRAVISFATFGIILIQFLNATGKLTRYLYAYIPFCLFLGLIILAGLSDRMKPVSFSPVLLVSWGGVTVCMLISGILVDSNVLADTLLWLVAFPVFFLVWGNRNFTDLVKPIINGIYLSFALFFLISIRSYPLNGTYYYSFFMNLNGLAMYMTAVSVAAITDIFSQEKFSARMLLADVILGASAAVAYYSASRASQVVLLISGCVGAVVFLIAKKETMGKKVLCYLLPAVLSLAILVPNTAVVINGANKAVVKFEKTWIKEEQKTPENPANPGNNQQIADKNTWEAIQSYNEERRKQGEGQDFDAFSTGRLDLWKTYLKEVGLLGNPASKVLTDANGKEIQKSAHNTLIQMAYEFGILAAVCFLIFNVVSGLKAVRLAYQKRLMDYSIFPVVVALAYGAYYLVEKILYPATSLLLLLYLISQAAVFPKEMDSKAIEEMKAKQ